MKFPFRSTDSSRIEQNVHELNIKIYSPIAFIFGGSSGGNRGGRADVFF